MSRFSFGDVVLAEFPFADQFEMKRRPALVISQDAEDDLILLRITSKVRGIASEVLIHEWKEAGLRVSSVVRLEKVVTSNVSYVITHLGSLAKSDALRVLVGLRKTCDRIVASHLS